jgi:signal peptidase II
MTPKLRIFLTSVLLAIPLDQVTKIWIDRNLVFGDRIPVIEGFFYLTHVRNPGAAFSLFATMNATYRTAFFVSISLVALGIIVSFYRNLAPGDRLSALALGSIFGGAIGNLIDRITRGEVVDFLQFRLWTGYSWPDFNFADTFIVVGVGLLVIELLANEGENRSGDQNDAVRSKVSAATLPTSIDHDSGSR